MKWEVVWDEYQYYAVLYDKGRAVFRKKKFSSRQAAERWCAWQNAIPYMWRERRR